MSRHASTAVRWGAYVAVAILFAVVCAVLSNWQFGRNEWRSEQLALVSRNYDAAPVPLGDVVGADGVLPRSAEWKPVVLHGEYVASGQLLARNRAHGGTSAYEVLVPFRLDDGRLMIVNRGWVPPSDDAHAEPEAVPAPPSGTATVVVRLRPGEALPASGRSAPEGQIATINLPLIAEMLRAAHPDLIQGGYGALVSEDPAPVTAPQRLDSPSDDPGPYLSYAIQWILFAIMGFCFIGYVIRTELRARKEDAASGDADAARTRRIRSGRTRDRDTVDEDALLDADDYASSMRST